MIKLQIFVYFRNVFLFLNINDISKSSRYTRKVQNIAYTVKPIVFNTNLINIIWLCFYTLISERVLSFHKKRRSEIFRHFGYFCRLRKTLKLNYTSETKVLISMSDLSKSIFIQENYLKSQFFRPLNLMFRCQKIQSRRSQNENKFKSL